MPPMPERPNVETMSFDRETLTRLLFGGGDIDCPEMELERPFHEQPKVFKGPGYIKRDDNGGIVFKIYPVDRSTDSYSGNEWHSTTKAGQIIERKSYYQLKAKDYRGQTWNADFILPGFSIGGSSVIVHGDIRELRASKTQDFSPVRSYLRMLFLDAIEIPCNAFTETRTIRAGDDSGFPGSGSLDLAKFSSCGLNFLLHSKAEALTVEVDSGAPMPPHLETRILEALQFVLAKTLHCRVSERMAGPDCTIRVTQESATSVGTRTMPPLHPRTLEACGRPTPAWEMFDKYLRFVLSYDKPDWHPCSIHIHRAREASVNAIDARALGITVAVEGLVNLAYPRLGRLTAAYKAAVKELRGYATKWPGFPDGGVGSSLRARLPGLVGQLNDVGAGKRLELLAEMGLVEGRLVRAWKKLRHPAAHAETPDPGKRQELADHVHAAGVLLNQLVFGAIGYEGPYSDYSTHDFPVRNYPPGRPGGAAEGVAPAGPAVVGD